MRLRSIHQLLTFTSPKASGGGLSLGEVECNRSSDQKSLCSPTFRRRPETVDRQTAEAKRLFSPQKAGNARGVRMQDGWTPLLWLS